MYIWACYLSFNFKKANLSSYFSVTAVLGFYIAKVAHEIHVHVTVCSKKKVIPSLNAVLLF